MNQSSFARRLRGGIWLIGALLGLAACGGTAPSAAVPSSPDVFPSLNSSSKASVPLETDAAPAQQPTPTLTSTPNAARPTRATASAPPAPTVTIRPSPVPTKATGVAVPPYYFGVNTYDEVLEQDHVRALATSAGARMVRAIVKWDQIEKTQGEYDWSSTDAIFTTLTESNFTPLAMIVDNPKWIANTPCGPVKDRLAFDRFLHALVVRYPKIRYWMLYNEPDNSNYPRGHNGGCFGSDDLDGNGKPDYADYAEHLKIAWRAIHRANPDAELVSGALAFDNFDQASAPPGYPGGGQGGSFNAQFLANLVKYVQDNPPDPGAKYFDILAYNFYPIYGPYWERQAGGVGIGAKANMLRNILRQANLPTRLLVSETGANAFNNGVEEQSRYVTKTYVRGIASGLVAVVWWTFRDFPDSAAPPQNTWKYGLLDQNNSPKPAYAAYQTLAHKLTGAQYLDALSAQGSEGYLLSQDNAGLAVVWASGDTPVTIAFSGGALVLTDMYGAERQVLDNSPEDQDRAAGRIGVQVDGNPLYIQAANP
ncbi:MAG: hypothetical protein HY741_01855 [Chloroflexi bacterium]|nr:hypothetical protein [Chloroflexota bacterium]